MSILTTSKLNTKGTFLIELTISILLVVIIIAPLTFLFGSTIRGFFVGRPSPFIQQVLNDAMEEISDNLRESLNITVALENQVTFFNKAGTEIIFRRNTSTKLLERVEGGITTFIPYYNMPTSTDRVTFEDPPFAYLTLGIRSNQTHAWTGGSQAPISSVTLTLRGALEDSNLTLRGIVTLRRK